jgi:hypothetical protein
VEAVLYIHNLRTCHNLVTGPTYYDLCNKFTKRAGLVLRSQCTKCALISLYSIRYLSYQISTPCYQ